MNLKKCLAAMADLKAQSLVEEASSIAQMAEWFLLVAKREVEISNDPRIRAMVKAASDTLNLAIPPMLADTETLAGNIYNPSTAH